MAALREKTETMIRRNRAAAFAILAAALYALSIPLSKLLLPRVGEKMMAGLLYAGAGIGMMGLAAARSGLKAPPWQEPLTMKELPWVIAMVLLDILAPILLMMGIARTDSASVSLLGSVEIVATSLIALLIFKEHISGRLWAAIALLVVAGAVLSFEGEGSFQLNAGSLMVLGACLCWGCENNCTRMISHKSSEEIVLIKGSFSGLGSLTIAFVMGERFPAPLWAALALALGFLSYGLSINLYIRAQKDLGAAKTSACYAVAPFLGAAFSMAMVGERPGLRFYAALAVMLAGTALVIRDTAASGPSRPRPELPGQGHARA